MEQETRRYNDAEKLQIIEEYMNSGEAMETFQAKRRMGHCTLSRWMTKFGLSNTSPKQFVEMKKAVEKSSEKSLVELRLEAEAAQPEKELKKEKLKSLAYSTMTDVAEEELGIDILDKYHLKVHRRKRTVRTTWSESWLHRFPNLVKDLVLTAANHVWVSDITYIETASGFVCLHLVTDACSKKIMGWRLSPSLHAEATISALQMAIRNAGCDLTGLIHHSDRGCQYCCEKYVKLLQDNGIQISMTQDGNPRDNAIAERVNGILKTEWLYDDHFTGFEDARKRVAQVIDPHNTKRPHLSLNCKTPAEAYFETGEQVRVWKNYYKSSRPEKVAAVISELTSGCRTTATY